MIKQKFYTDLTDTEGNTYTFSILIGQDLGKNEIIIFDHIKDTQKMFKKIKRAMKYLNKKKFPLEEFKKVIKLNNEIMRLRNSEKRKITIPSLGFEYSRETDRKNPRN